MKRIDIGYWLGEAEQLIMSGWRWRKARTFADMRDISIKDLIAERGDEDDHPNAGEDSAVYLQTAVEIALTRAGMLVDHSILGGRYELSGRKMRAVITGHAPTEVLTWLKGITYSTRYEVVAHRPYKPGQPVEDAATRARETGVTAGREIATGDPLFFVGGRQTSHELFTRYPVRPSAGRELRDCWQITIYDPQWGGNDLFAFLLDTLDTRSQEARTAGL